MSDDKPKTNRSWSTVDDEELRHLRMIAGCVMQNQVGGMSQELLEMVLHRALTKYCELLAAGIAGGMAEFDEYLAAIAAEDNAEMDKPPAFTGTMDEFLEGIEPGLCCRPPHPDGPCNGYPRPDCPGYASWLEMDDNGLS